MDALAGKTTIANIFLKAIGNLTVSQSLAYILGAGGVAYGVGERKVRQKTIQRLQDRNQELEKRIDPHRTSSELTRRGETNPKDE